ncbi:hypothetical protein D3C84_1129600 [compost metagenome]
MPQACVLGGECRVGKAAPIGQHVHGGARQVGLGQAEDLEEAVAVERWLAPGEADLRGVLGDQRDQCLDLIEQPAVVGAFRRL